MAAGFGMESWFDVDGKRWEMQPWQPGWGEWTPVVDAAMTACSGLDWQRREMRPWQQRGLGSMYSVVRCIHGCVV